MGSSVLQGVRPAKKANCDAAEAHDEQQYCTNTMVCHRQAEDRHSRSLRQQLAKVFLRTCAIVLEAARGAAVQIVPGTDGFDASFAETGTYQPPVIKKHYQR